MTRPLTHRHGCRGAALATRPGRYGWTVIWCLDCRAVGHIAPDSDGTRRRGGRLDAAPEEWSAPDAEPLDDPEEAP